MKHRSQAASLRLIKPEEIESPGPISETLLRVLDESLAALEKARIPHVVGGGLAARAYGLRKTTDDIDIFVQPPMASSAAKALESAGFRVWVEDPPWLHKALKSEIEVDIIYESAGTFHVDEEAFQRAVKVNLDGRPSTILSPEDFFVIKALVATPVTPRHWEDAVKVVQRYRLDWQYVVRRARGRPRKVIKALLFGYDHGVDIPVWVLATLMKPTFGDPS